MIKQNIFMILSVLMIVGIAFISPGFAEDMRTMNIEAEKKKNALLEKARLEKKTAQNESEKIKKSLLSDKHFILKAITGLEAQNKNLEKQNINLEKKLSSLKEKENQTRLAFQDIESVIRELVGMIRINSKDLDSLLNQSIQSAFEKKRRKYLKSLSDSGTFPEMDHIRAMTDLLFDEIRKSGEVKISRGNIVNRRGEEVPADILFLGNFTAAYQLPDETGFLIFSDKSRRLFALSKTPPFRMKNKINQYMSGKSDDAPIDLSGGSALRQLTHRPNLIEQIQKGGPIIWPILLILVLAVAIIAERVIHLYGKSMDSDHLIDQIKDRIADHKYQNCVTLCERYKNKPVSRVLLSGIHARHKELSDLENALQEAILREIPDLEKFLSTLGMLAAISPLLGLLGTVTGMINTFQVINYFGTEDPRMMSGGISEALVTTMLGLSVAIPIMLSHTLLTRKVENMIAQMEEKAVALINAISGSKVT